jgi:hypothetical protein
MIWIDFYNWFTGLFGREPIGNEGAIIGYDLVFRGNIVDLDPVISTVTITATSGNLFNDTRFEASNNIHLEINTTDRASSVSFCVFLFIFSQKLLDKNNK